MAKLTKPGFWLLVFLVCWLVLVVVQISMGMGGAPGGGGGAP